MTWLLRDVNKIVNGLWPEDTAADWDRVGLTVGHELAPVKKIMLALDAVQSTVSEALETDVDLLLTHHPLLLRGITSVTENTAKGALLAQMIRGNCALISAHTNADQPEDGVSDVLAKRFGMNEIRPIVAGPVEGIGMGRVGNLPSQYLLLNLHVWCTVSFLKRPPVFVSRETPMRWSNILRYGGEPEIVCLMIL